MTVDAKTGAESAETQVEEPAGPETIVCTNPATGERIDEIDAVGPEQVGEAVQRSREAQAHWSRLPVDERAEYLLEAREELLDHRGELRDLVIEETGKAQPDAMAELLILFDTLGYYARKGPELLEDERLDLHLLKNKRVTVQHAPAGIVLNIAPWNYPLDLSISPAIPALIAGNSVIIKPSEWTPLTAIRAAEIINRAGLPDGLLQVVPGYGDTGAALIDEADAVSFTGSVSTGRKVSVEAAKNLVPCTLELGGKDPSIVLDDANVERAVNGSVWGAFFNCGQTCMSVERVFVDETVYDEFCERAVQLTRRLRQGVPSETQVDVGAITFPKQLDIIEEHVEDAVEKGARILTGGKRREISGGNFYEPTILVDVTPEMLVMREETFGPVMPIMEVPSAAEAIRLANDSPYGLNASIWSTDRQRAQRLARQLESGNVCINDVIASYVAIEAPYGGVKQSGVGRRKGIWELEDFTEPKTIMEDIIGMNREPFWYPYSDKLINGVDKAFEALFRRGITGKIKGLFG